jgi:hypothetical protein
MFHFIKLKLIEDIFIYMMYSSKVIGGRQYDKLREMVGKTNGYGIY